MKMRDMKKGGYTLFSNKVRKILLAVGLSMLSVCTMSVFSYAAPTMTPKFKKLDTTNNKILYQVKIEESEENPVFELYTKKGEEANVAMADAAKVIWQEREDGILAVFEIPATLESETLVPNVDKIIVENSAITEGTNTSEVELSSESFEEDSEGPKIQWAYKNEEEGYIQFEAKDKTNVYKVVDKEGVERVKIDDKEQNEVVTLRYMLKGTNDEAFDLYDILGNKETVTVSEITTKYTIAAKNANGQKIVLKMSLPENATLQSIETLKGGNILQDPNVTKESKSQNNDSLVAVYSKVTEGTTYLNIKYKLQNENDVKEMRVLLDLDVEAPVLVKRNDSGLIAEESGSARAYKNITGTKAIVEVKDMVSGITKIVACNGVHEFQESTQKFEIKDLPKSVLQLIDLPEGTTCIRVYDGIGNVRELDLQSAIAQDKGDEIQLEMILENEKEDNKDVVTATFGDTKAGVAKFVRSKKDMAKTKNIVQDYEKSYTPSESAYASIKTTDDINNYYRVTPQEVKLKGEQLQGIPEFTVVDALGNSKEFNMNDILFDADSILMSTSGQDENTVVKAIVVKLKDVRRIKKITATINDEETILESFETALTNVGEGPVEIDKAYEMPNDAHVTKITVYHSNEDVTQNEISVDFTTPQPEDSPIVQIPEEQPEGEEGEEGEEKPKDPRTDYVEIISGEMAQTDSAQVITKIKYGIKKITYSDGCIIEFSEDLPKEVEVYTKDKHNNPLTSVIITDALDHEYNVADGSGDLAKYAPEGYEQANP